MDKLKRKHENISKALASFEKAVNILELSIQEGKGYNPHMSYEEEYCEHRDSAFQRFEYSTDLFWRYLKKYLEGILHLSVVNGPEPVIRASCAAGIITEQEGEKILDMVRDRNMTSHMYMEEIAEQLVAKMPEYFSVMHAVVQRLETKKINVDEQNN